MKYNEVIQVNIFGNTLLSLNQSLQQAVIMKLILCILLTNLWI